MPDALPTPTCPEAATLRALLDRTLPTDQQTATQAHVDGCPLCIAALRQMTVGSESWIGMAEKLKVGSDDDPQLLAAMERLKAEDGSASDGAEPADPQRTLDFLSPADDPKLLGKLGQHEISEVVGWGGMGVVLKAYDPGLHRVVAVKVLASHLAHHAVARKRFIREAQAAAAVCHDNVITIHAIDDGSHFSSFTGERGGVSPPVESLPNRGANTPRSPVNQSLPKIVMQFVAGGSLQERIDQDGPLELKEVLRIAMQTAAGLAAAHAQGVVHRDVKPANILLENGVERVKLTDFGLARVMDDASLTLSGVIAGTPQYMAPEQAWGRDVDARADLFSLGAVMYAMCTGHSPFRARTTMAVLKRVCEEAPRPLRAINPDVPEWLAAIIDKLLAKNPDERFQSAAEVSDVLGRWLAHVQQPNVLGAPPRIVAVPRRAGRVRAAESLEDRVTTTAASGTILSAPANDLWHLDLKHLLWPMLVMGTLLGIFLVLIIRENGTRGLDSSFGFSVFSLLATLALASAFRTAWNTSSWFVWIGAILFLPAAASAFGWMAAYREIEGVVQLVCALQALLALSLWFGLLFVRPLLVRGSGNWMRERLTGWQQLFAIACFTIIGTPLVLLLIYWLSYAPPRPDIALPPRKQDPADVARHDGQAAMNPTQPLVGVPVQRGEVPELLIGRWVVVSMEGAALDAPGATAGGFGASSSPGGMAGMIGGGAGFGMGSGTSATSVQWIGFRNANEISSEDGRAAVFDGRESEFFTDFDLTASPPQLFLRFQHRSEFDGSTRQNWRSGIFRLERDRLIVCWSAVGPPTEFEIASNPLAQLLVLRREWNPPADFDPSKTPPPRAVIAFTADEAKRYQEAWARSANVPAEMTNSLGMKFRTVPPGQLERSKAFDRGINPNQPETLRVDVAGPLYVGVHEVTVEQFRKFVEATGYVTTAEQNHEQLGASRPTWRKPGIEQDNEQHPVVCVSWQDAQAFCHWLSDVEKQSYRLPTNYEWIFACRSGMSNLHAGSSVHRSHSRFFETTAPVGSHSANDFGLHDVFGNVWEQCFDFTGSGHLRFGGGFNSRTSACHWESPLGTPEYWQANDTGFRVVHDCVPQTIVPGVDWPLWNDLVATPARLSFSESLPLPSSNGTHSLIAVCGVVPVLTLPHWAECIDFEIERKEQDPTKPWGRLDLEPTRKMLEKLEDFEQDEIPNALRHPVFTMPLPELADGPAPAAVVGLRDLAQIRSTTNYDLTGHLFRFFDFHITKEAQYQYRVRFVYVIQNGDKALDTIKTRWLESVNFVEAP